MDPMPREGPSLPPDPAHNPAPGRGQPQGCRTPRPLDLPPSPPVSQDPAAPLRLTTPPRTPSLDTP